MNLNFIAALINGAKSFGNLFINLKELSLKEKLLAVTILPIVVVVFSLLIHWIGADVVGQAMSHTGELFKMVD